MSASETACYAFALIFALVGAVPLLLTPEVGPSTVAWSGTTLVMALAFAGAGLLVRDIRRYPGVT